MAEAIPFTPSVPYQRLEVTLDGKPIVMDARWNARDEAYYLDVFDVDLNPIAHGLKVALGAKMGRGYTHEFFRGRALIAHDRSGTGTECGLDDLGDRVAILYLTEADVALALSPPFVLPTTP